MFDIEASHAISYIHTCFDKVKSRNYIISLIYEKEREREREREKKERERERERKTKEQERCRVWGSTWCMHTKNIV
jgi:hypothetical protein